MRQIISYFDSPEEYTSVGARIRRGVLLYGPSGTGKTMLAKALANEAGVNFIYKSASQFVEKYVGVGPRRIRDLFDIAKENSPCIVFIDEIDAIGARTVETDHFGSNNDERNATVNQLLVEMDGFEENDLVVVMAATNREKFLDFALVRSGRFDLKIQVHLPVLRERVGILKLKLESKRERVSFRKELGEEGLEEICKEIVGFSGADIDAAINEAVYKAIDNGVKEEEKLVMTIEDLKFGFGKIKDNLISVRNSKMN